VVFELTVLALLAVIGVTGLSVVSDFESRRVHKRRKAWERAASRLGLRFAPSKGPTGMGRIWGEVSGRRIRLVQQVMTGEAGSQHTAIAIELRPSVPRDLVLASEGLGSGLANIVGRGDFALGDAAFDRRFLLRGLPEEIAAVFGARAREALLGESTIPGPLLRGGWLTLTRDDPLTATAAVEQYVEQGLAVAAALDQFDDPLARLIDNARHDPDAGVQTTCLRLLAEQFGARPEVRDLAGGLVHLPDREVRLLAMHLLGEEDPRAFVVAREVAFDDPSAPAPAIAEALGWLDDAGPAVDDLPGLRERATTASADVAEQAIRCLGTVGRLEEIELLFPLQTTRGAVGDAALAAAERIRSRLGIGGDAGRLSVSDEADAAGGLSRAAPTGALAVEKKP